MVLVYEIAVGVLLVLLCRWLWRIGGGAEGGNRTGLLLGVAAVAVFVWPWLRDAHWRAVLETVAIGLVVAAGVLGYARLIGRVRRATRQRDGDR